MIKNIAIVSAVAWNKDIIQGLSQGVIRACDKFGAKHSIIEVSGVYEIPLACQRATDKYDAIVAIGCLIQGETLHFDLVARACSDGIMKVQLEKNIAIGMGVLAVENIQQAEQRCADNDKNAGYIAAHAVLSGLVI